MATMVELLRLSALVACSRRMNDARGGGSQGLGLGGGGAGRPGEGGREGGGGEGALCEFDGPVR